MTLEMSKLKEHQIHLYKSMCKDLATKQLGPRPEMLPSQRSCRDCQPPSSQHMYLRSCFYCGCSWMN